MIAPTHASLQITDDHKIKMKAPKGKVWSYHLTAEEARATDVALTIVYLFIFSIDYSLSHAYIYVCD